MRYRGYWDRLQFYIEQRGEIAQLIDKEYKNMKYKLTLSLAVVDTSKPAGSPEAQWFGPVTTVWPNLDDDGLAALMGLSASVIKEAEKVDNQGGILQAVFSNKIESMDGNPLPQAMPPGANSAQTFSGLTRHGATDVEEATIEIGKKVVKLGRQHAESKEGKKKPKP